MKIKLKQLIFLLLCIYFCNINVSYATNETMQDYSTNNYIANTYNPLENINKDSKNEGDFWIEYFFIFAVIIVFGKIHEFFINVIFKPKAEVPTSHNKTKYENNQQYQIGKNEFKIKDYKNILGQPNYSEKKDSTQNWLLIKDNVFEKYGRKCIKCGATDNIDVHHKIPISEGGTNCLENLIPLCRNCHEELHKFKLGQQDNTKIDIQYGSSASKDKKSMIGYKICNAIEKGYRIKIKYKSGKADNEKITERIVRPLEVLLGSESQNKLVNNSKYDQNKSFLRAFCELRNEERLFRMDRIIDVVETYKV